MHVFFYRTLSAILLIISASTLAKGGPEQITLSRLHIEKTYEGFVVAGNVHNDTDKTLKIVYVEFDLFQNGSTIGKTFDEGFSIGPGANRMLKAPIDTLRGKPDSFKVTDIQVVN